MQPCNHDAPPFSKLLEILKMFLEFVCSDAE